MNLVELDRALRQLRLSGIAAVLDTRLRQAQAEKMAPIDLVSALVADERRRRRTACPSRIRCQAATGSCTRSRQWETQRTPFRCAEAPVRPPANVSGVWPSKEAWQRAALS